jgi:hypothetical protein
VNLSFNRSFGPGEGEEWGDLLSLLGQVDLSEVVWMLDKCGKFTTKSLYKFLLNPGVQDGRMVDMGQLTVL